MKVLECRVDDDLHKQVKLKALEENNTRVYFGACQQGFSKKQIEVAPLPMIATSICYAKEVSFHEILYHEWRLLSTNMKGVFLWKS